MSDSTVILFTRFGIGDAPADLQHKLVRVFLTLLEKTNPLPRQMLFYTEGVKLVCTGSPVLEQLRTFQAQGVEMVICSTCLNYFEITDQVQVGIVGGMGDILESITRADKVVSV
ncbi:MAG TPA: DsrE family protein [Anaerolineae bacterium]